MKNKEKKKTKKEKEKKEEQKKKEVCIRVKVEKGEKKGIHEQTSVP